MIRSCIDAGRVLVMILGRRRLAVSLAGSAVVAVLEVVGVGLVLPLILAITDPAAASALPDVIESIVPTEFDRDASAMIAVAVAILFAIRGCLTLGFRWWLLGTLRRGEATLSAALMLAYLRAPIRFQRSRSTADLLRVLQLSVEQFFTRVALPMLGILTDGLIVIALSTVLLVLEPALTAGALLYFGVCALVFSRLTNRRMTRLGYALQVENAEEVRTAQESFGGATEAAVRGVSAYFADRFAAVKRRAASTKQRQQFIGELPRNYLESAFLVGIGLLVLLVLSTSDSQADAAAALALVAAASFRIMPSLIKIVTSLTALRSGMAAVELVTRDIDDLRIDQHDLTRARRPAARAEVRPDSHFPSQSKAPALEAKDLVFAYSSPVPTLDNISFEVPAGAWLGIVGESGSGKSTLLLMLLGLLEPDHGEIRADGESITEDMSAWRTTIGFVPQDSFLLDASLAENVRFGLREDDDDERLLEAIEGAALSRFVESLDAGLETNVAERGSRLSGGQRQRIGIARALYRRPRLLLLDEATSSLDADTESSVLDSLEAMRGQITIVTVSHGEAAVSRCDRIVVLDQGRVRAAGTWSEISGDPLLVSMRRAMVDDNDGGRWRA